MTPKKRKRLIVASAKPAALIIDFKLDQCPSCAGSGDKIYHIYQMGSDFHAIRKHPCRRCAGRGKLPEKG